MNLLAKVLKKIPLIAYFLDKLMLHWEMPSKHVESKFRQTILTLSSSDDVSDRHKRVLKEYLWSTRQEYFKQCKLK
jgi:hypothetical protein